MQRRAYSLREYDSAWSGVRYGKILLLLAGLSVYIYIFNIAGFPLSTFLLMLFLFKSIEPTSWRAAILSSVVTTAAAFAIFKTWLAVPFPAGILGF